MNNKETLNTNIDTLEKFDGIEILVDMAKSKKIDPWDIDIIQITDMFLEKILEIKHNNLKLTGRTLFFAAVLLRIKSNYLEGIDPFKTEEEDFPEEYDDTFDETFESNDLEGKVKKLNVLSLENALSRRTSIRKNRLRKVTLEDLIKQLRELEEKENRQTIKYHQEKAKNRKSYAHITPDDILDMAHDEYIEDEINNLHDLLYKMFESEEKIELKKLLNSGMDKISTYIALLFLASRNQIDLVQDEFYSDLFIIKEVS